MEDPFPGLTSAKKNNFVMLDPISDPLYFVLTSAKKSDSVTLGSRKNIGCVGDGFKSGVDPTWT